MLIGVLGKKGAGKTTFSNYLFTEYAYILESFAHPLKEGVRQFFGFNDRQVHGDLKEVVDPFWGITPRMALQIYGTEISQFEFPKYVEMMTGQKLFGREFWIKSMQKRLSAYTSPVVIQDVRFKHEAQFILDQGGSLVRIHNTSLPISADTHKSETELDDVQVPTITNDGVDMKAFYSEIKMYMNNLRGSAQRL